MHGEFGMAVSDVSLLAKLSLLVAVENHKRCSDGTLHAPASYNGFGYFYVDGKLRRDDGGGASLPKDAGRARPQRTVRDSHPLPFHRDGMSYFSPSL